MESAVYARALLADVFLPKFWSFLPHCVLQKLCNGWEELLIHYFP